jgi:hypothetical protein
MSVVDAVQICASCCILGSPGSSQVYHLRFIAPILSCDDDGLDTHIHKQPY